VIVKVGVCENWGCALLIRWNWVVPFKMKFKAAKSLQLVNIQFLTGEYHAPWIKPI
jgi:hypothetical protein